MTCFTSQLMILRPNFVRPRVPSQSDLVIRHMVRCNTEAYANIFLYLGLVLRDLCGLGNPFVPQKTGEDI